MPTTYDALFLAPALAPITGNADLGCGLRDLARALAARGVRVTVAIADAEGLDDEAHGLARRLEPRPVDGHELIVFEGNLEGGDVEVYAFRHADGGGAVAPALLARAALALLEDRDRQPMAVHAWHATAAALAAIDGPLRVLHIDGPQAIAADPAVAEELAAADRIVLPSRSAARAARSDDTGPLAAHCDKIVGIAPGANRRQWTPLRDSLLSEPLVPTDPESRARAKRHLQRRLRLPHREATPVLGVIASCPLVTRASADSLLELGAQLAITGGGPTLEALSSRRPSQAAAPAVASDAERRELQHQIVAGSDFILVGDTAPSPVSAMGFLAYGTAPVAPAAGEWADRVVEFEPTSGSGSGFLYAEGDPAGLVAAVRRAVRCFDRAPVRAALAERAVAVDTSWDTAAARLIELY